MYIDKIFGGCRQRSTNTPLNFNPAIELLVVRDTTTSLPDVFQIINNLNFGSATTSNMLAVQVFEEPVGTLVIETLQVYNPFSLDLEGRVIVPPGHNMALGITARSDTSSISVPIRFTVIWYELDK